MTKYGKEGSMNNSVGTTVSYCFNSFIASKRKFQMGAWFPYHLPSAY